MNVSRYDQPFTHWVVDDFAPPELLRPLDVPAREWDGWEARYDNDCERYKNTCRNLDALGPFWQALFGWLTAAPMVYEWGLRCGADALWADPGLHGGGLHVTYPGGHLSPHLDYARHPHCPFLERRLNLVLFLNREWREEWGGAFELYDDSGSNVAQRVYPAFNRAVLWCPGDVEFHGTQKVADQPAWRCPACWCVYTDPAHLDANGYCSIDGPESYVAGAPSPAFINWLALPRVPPRVTAAAYYLAPARATAVRKRALFVPARKPAA